ncbi:hypothetical protein GJ496_006074 [Pomphorhynchus laevis]|nr:hypothetical protein GJ496_006074 [Pomphorhynchus laevis]
MLTRSLIVICYLWSVAKPFKCPAFNLHDQTSTNPKTPINPSTYLLDHKIMPGAPQEYNPQALGEIGVNLDKYNYTISDVNLQIVSGKLFTFILNGENYKCHVTIHSQKWKNLLEVIKCQCISSSGQILSPNEAPVCNQIIEDVNTLQKNMMGNN